ncbi:MAG TPA: replicative DNA helicase [Blastocatellia bacterium]|nr:replicative DNA helicase [Blastocatellia bacterium]
MTKAAGSGTDYALEKALPGNIEAERLILGAILLDNTTINQAAERLKREDFFLDSHRRIYDRMLYLSENGRAIDPITLAEELQRTGDLTQIGGPAYIASLFDGVPRFSNIESYVGIVKGKSMLRRLITTSNQIMASCFDAEDDPEEILDQAEKMILAIAEDRIRQGFTHISEIAQKQFAHIEEIAGRQQLITGIATGFRDLDYMTSGLQRGDLIIVAARPSMGKCLAADSEIVLADGSIATIEEIYRRRAARLLTLNSNWKFGLAEPSAFVDDGMKPVFRVTTRLGRQVESTLTHPYLTLDGWRSLAELKPGDRIAVPREISVFGSEELSNSKIKLLAYLIGDGCLTKQSPEFTNTNPRVQEDFKQAVTDFPGLSVRLRVSDNRAPTLIISADPNYTAAGRMAFAQKLRAFIRTQPRGASRRLAAALGVAPSLVCLWQKGCCAPDPEMFEKLCDALDLNRQELVPAGLAAIRKSSRNRLVLWLEDLGLWGKNAHHKTIPAIVFRLTRPKLALFLNRLFATDGWVAITGNHLAQIGYSTVSERLARQVQHLLLRFGIIAKLRQRQIRYQDSRRAAWQLDITHADSIRRFARDIGIFSREDKLELALQILDKETNRTNRDLIPSGIWNLVATAKGDESWQSLARRAGIKGCSNLHVGQRGMPRRKLMSLAEAVSSDSLRTLAESDVYWDEIISIEPLGLKQVYDLTIPETHNFVANDICVHNTAFSLNMAQNAALMRQEHGHRAVVGIFSLEMSKEQLVQRMMCSQARLDAHRLRSGMLSKDDWRRLAQAVGELAEADIYIDDTPAITTLELRAKARRLRQEKRSLDLLIVDYLQLMSGRGRVESRQQEVSQISRELKGIAKELNVPLIALSQLSRATETRTDHRPQLSDLRESGGIEQDADLVMFIYRDEVYHPETEKQNTAEIIIGKQRNGPIGTVELIFLKQLTRFENKAYEG